MFLTDFEKEQKQKMDIIYTLSLLILNEITPIKMYYDSNSNSPVVLYNLNKNKGTQMVNKIIYALLIYGLVTCCKIRIKTYIIGVKMKKYLLPYCELFVCVL